MRRGRKLASSRSRSRRSYAPPIMLASMLDILMAVLFFLLKNYSTVVSDFTVTKDIALPRSTAVVPPQSALQLVVTQTAILLDDQEIVQVVNGKIPRSELWRDGITILKLAQALKEQKNRAQFIQGKDDKSSFSGTIVLQADKNLEFDLLKRVIYTAGVQDFVMLKLAVIKKDSA